MHPGKNCPACGKDTGIWPVFIAAMPSRVTCPHCRARLHYAETGVLVAVLIALLLTCGAGAFYFVLRFYPLARLEFAFLWVGLVLALWLPLEFAVAIYLRTNKTLHQSDRR